MLIVYGKLNLKKEQSLVPFNLKWKKANDQEELVFNLAKKLYMTKLLTRIK